MRMLDHFLGCLGQDRGVWLATGDGVTPVPPRVGQRIAQLFPLGNAADRLAAQDPRTYLARSAGLYLVDRRALNVADSLLERLLRATLFWDAFWRWALAVEQAAD